MSQDPTRTRVIELLHQWCDDPPDTSFDAIDELKDLLYPTKKERDEAEFEMWWSTIYTEHRPITEAAARSAWLAARGHN
jgi:hypothetical protein